MAKSRHRYEIILYWSNEDEPTSPRSPSSLAARLVQKARALHPVVVRADQRSGRILSITDTRPPCGCLQAHGKRSAPDGLARGPFAPPGRETLEPERRRVRDYSPDPTSSSQNCER